MEKMKAENEIYNDFDFNKVVDNNGQQTEE